jgi:hypothetical protein
MKTAIALLAICLTGSLAVWAASPDSDFQAASDRALQNARTPAGREYEAKVRPLITKAVQDAVQECLRGNQAEAEFGIVFFIAANGQAQRVTCSSREPIVTCAVKKIRFETALPPPPGDKWAVQIRMSFDFWQSSTIKPKR